MDKMTFASYKFKPSDVIEGLNRYFAKTKAFRYLRVPLEIKNGVWTGNPDYRKDIVFTNSPPDNSIGSLCVRCWKYYLICDPEEVVGVAINWLREEHDIFYTPGMEDTQYKPEKLTWDDVKSVQDVLYAPGMVSVARVREALGIAEDSDIFDAIAFLKKSNERAHSEMYKARGEKYELLKQVRETLGLNPEVGFLEALKCARGDMDATTRLRLESSELRHQNHQFGKRLADIRKAAGMSDLDPTDLVEYIKDLAKSRRETLDDWFGEHATVLGLKSRIFEIYREIFDCSNGDPEGTDAELLQDILTEYKRVLNLKNVAEEKTIKWKERALENEEEARKYKDTAKENRVQWNNTNAQLQWAQEENRKWLEKYEKLKSELNEMTTLYCGAAVGNGSLCEELAKEREWTKRLEQKLIEIQDICER